MPSSGDVVVLDFGLPQGHEADFPRPAVVMTADKVLNTVQQPRRSCRSPRRSVTSTAGNGQAKVRFLAEAFTSVPEQTGDRDRLLWIDRVDPAPTRHP
jgi:mRNA-degrading endonuclease toxin of MazEF toxin-antitoxin module